MMNLRTFFAVAFATTLSASAVACAAPVGRSSAPTEVPDDGVATPAPAPIPTSKPAPSPGCEHRPGGALIDLEIKDRRGAVATPRS
ncbi:MAG TPA: hypothetical protein PLR99_22285 [Polyangiaceae bacterium]|nr:hypothetical protein [Polyangiaceae bacterium]